MHISSEFLSEPWRYLTPELIAELYPEMRQLPPSQGEIIAWNDLGCQYFYAAMMYALQETVLFYRLGEIHNYSTLLTPLYSDPIPCYLNLAQVCFQQAPKTLISEINGQVLACLLSQNPAHKANIFAALKQREYQLAPMHHQYKSTLHHIVSHLEPLNLKGPEPLWRSLIQSQHFHNRGGLSFKLLAPDYSLVYDKHPSAAQMAQAFARHRQLLLGEQKQDGHFRLATWREAMIRLILEAAGFAQDRRLKVRIEPALGDAIPVSTERWDLSPQNAYDLICLWHLSPEDYQRALQTQWAALEPNGFLFGAFPRSQADPIALQTDIARLTEQWPTLIDRESFSDTLIFYLQKSEPRPVTSKGLILMRPDSVETFGGADYQMFKSRAVLQELGVHTDISLACRLDFDAYDFLYIVGYLHEDYIYRRLAQTRLPKFAMPITTLYFVASCTAESIFEKLQQIALDVTVPPSELIHGYLASTQTDQPQAEAGFERLSPYHQSLEKRHKKHSLQLGEVSDFLLPQGKDELPYIFPGLQEIETIPHQILPNGCDPEVFLQADPEPFRQTSGLTDFILCVGRIEPNKNQLFLTYALRETGIPIVLIGRETVEGYLALCRWLGNGQVYQFQNLPFEELASAYKAARLFVLPSACENYPLSTLEAAFADTPVAMTNNALQGDLFQDSFYFFDPMKIQDIRETVLQAWQTDNTPRIQRAKALVETHCTWTRMGETMATIFKSRLALPPDIPAYWYQGQFVQRFETLQLPAQKQIPVLYSLENSLPFWQLSLSEREAYRTYLWQAHSALEKHFLLQLGCQQVDLKIPARVIAQETADEGATGAEELDALNTVRFLCFYHPQDAFFHRLILRYYLTHFDMEQDVSLMIYIPPEYGEPDLETEILDILDRLDLEPETIPDLVVLMGQASVASEQHLFQQASLIVAPFRSLWGHEALLYQAWQSNSRMASFQFDPALESDFLLRNFSALTQADPKMPLECDDMQLGTMLQKAFQA